MSEVTRKDETTTRRIYSIPSPTNWTEVSKALAWIRQDVEASGLSEFDDTVTVEAWDDEIRFWFILPKEAS
jgi:hypothetical protein